MQRTLEGLLRIRLAPLLPVSFCCILNFQYLLALANKIHVNFRFSSESYKPFGVLHTTSVRSVSDQ